MVALVAVVALLCLLGEGGKDQELRIGVKKRPETCDMRTKSGDRLSMHYTVKLAPLSLSAGSSCVVMCAGNSGRRDRV